MSVPHDYFYSKTHEWVFVIDGIATIGITDFAQSQLSDLTFVELPKVDVMISSGEEAAVVESVKAAADVYSPVSGKIIEINNNLEDAPETINQDAFKEGWLFKIKMSDESELDLLMDSDSYEEICPEE